MFGYFLSSSSSSLYFFSFTIFSANSFIFIIFYTYFLFGWFFIRIHPLYLKKRRKNRIQKPFPSKWMNEWMNAEEKRFTVIQFGKEEEKKLISSFSRLSSIDVNTNLDDFLLLLLLLLRRKYIAFSIVFRILNLDIGYYRNHSEKHPLKKISLLLPSLLFLLWVYPVYLMQWMFTFSDWFRGGEIKFI